MSGSLFYEKPTDWEVKHAKAFKDGKAFLETNGILPPLPKWDDHIARFKDNPDRYSTWHPNFAQLIEQFIERSGEHPTNPRPPVWPIDRPGWPPQTGPIVPPVNPPGEGCTECDPCLPAQTVPEPPAMVGMAVAIGVWFVAYLWLRKTAKGSVGEA